MEKHEVQPDSAGTEGSSKPDEATPPPAISTHGAASITIKDADGHEVTMSTAEAMAELRRRLGGTR